jgi:CheY-like chemotaxis protein
VKKKKDYRILIAEDNQAMRRIMGTMLSGLGYDDQVSVVNGIEAWERIQEDDIDMDWRRGRGSRKMT